MRIVGLGLVVVLVAAAGSRSVRADIVGGEEVQASDPIRDSTVALYDPSPDGKGGALCTASLIGKDVAVTAAHCIDPRGPAPVLLFGRDVAAPDTIKRQVTGAKIHPDYSRKAGHGMDEGDIALVRFPGGLPPGYHAIRPASSESALGKGEDAVLAGYGISNARRKTGAGRLRKAKVRISNPRPGKKEMVLDQSHGQGACHGDSGGPAFVREGGKVVLAGVTNRSYPPGSPDDCAHQVVYTKLPAYRSWIAKSKKELRAGARPPSEFKQRSSSMTSGRLSRHLKRAGVSHMRRLATHSHPMAGARRRLGGNSKRRRHRGKAQAHG
jgi:hypothetical protein